MAECKDVHKGHRKRVKENVLKNGFSQLEEHRLLELILFYSIPRGDTNEIAHNLINRFGSLNEVFRASPEQLTKVHGVGENTGIMIAAAGEAFKRMSKRKLNKRARYKTTESLKTLAQTLLEGEIVENVVLMCFDEAMKLKFNTVISSGDFVSSEIDMKNIIKALIDNDATVAVLAHNHPLSDAQPSAYDIDSIRTVSITLRKIGCSLADHIIIGSNSEAYSMYNDERFTGLFY